MHSLRAGRLVIRRSKTDVPSKQIKSLQAARGLAALLVVLFHTSKTIFQSPAFWPEVVFGKVFDFGHAGVVFFFVLSGFIIFSAHREDIGSKGRLGTYLIKRFVRVYPAYWVVLVPVAAVYFLMPQLSKPELTDHGVIANSFALVGADNRASLAVAWTLFHEVLFYLMFATLIIHRGFGIGAMAFWFGACAILALLGVPVSYHLSVINLMFLAGIAAFWITDRYAVHRPAALLALGAALFVATGLIEVYARLALPEILMAGYGVGSFIAVIGCVMLERSRPIRVPWVLMLLGDASYSIYLVHYPALSVAARFWIRIFGRTSAPAHLTFVVIVAAVVSTGLVFHLLIERPILAKSKSFIQALLPPKRGLT